MSRLESIVRPVVVPNIRPAPARPKAPDDDAARGVCVLNGSSGGLIDLSISSSDSISRQRSNELKRRYDEVRVYQREDDGTVNRENFVDVEVVNRLWLQAGDGTIQKARFKRVKETDNVEIIKPHNFVENEAFFASHETFLYTHEDFK